MKNKAFQYCNKIMEEGNGSNDVECEKDEITITYTQKGKESIVYKGFKFLKEKVTEKKIYWCCMDKRNGCKARLHTNIPSDGAYKLLYYNGDNSHIDHSNAVLSDVSNFINCIKVKARSNHFMIPSQIINEETMANNVDHSCLFFPNDKSCKDRIRYAQSSSMKISEPERYEDIRLSKNMKVNGEPFLLLKKEYDKGSYILVLGKFSCCKM